MKLGKQFVSDELRKEGQNEKVQETIEKHPEEIDHDQRARLLQNFRFDPGELAEKAAERGPMRV